MNAQALHDQIQSASRSLRRCDCGSAVAMAYHPGCTFIHCIKEKQTKAALPDWQPDELARRWNQRLPLDP
jgi:hypothetical protein